jgi:hypothetical protein
VLDGGWHVACCTCLLLLMQAADDGAERALYSLPEGAEDPPPELQLTRLWFSFALAFVAFLLCK